MHWLTSTLARAHTNKLDSENEWLCERAKQRKKFALSEFIQFICIAAVASTIFTYFRIRI